MASKLTVLDRLMGNSESLSLSNGNGQQLARNSDVANHGSDAPVSGENLPNAAESLLQFLSAASFEMHQPLDHAVSRRSLGDAFRDFEFGPGAAAEIGRRLQAMVPAWRLRVDPLWLTVREAVALVRPTAPLAILQPLPGGELRWLLIADHRGRRVKVLSSSAPEDAAWISIKQLHGMLTLGRDEKREWLALQPLLPCEAEHGDHGHGPTPLARYLQLLAPERSDIGVIVVFAIVVGLLALSTPIAVEALVNTVAFGQFIQPVVVLAVMLFVFLAFAAAMRAVQAYVAEIIQRRIFVRVASDLAQRLPRVPADFWNRRYGPELINRFFEVVTVQKVTAQLLLDGLTLVLQTLVGMTVIAFYHPVLLGFDAFLLLLIAGIVFVLGRGAVNTSIDESRKKYATAAWLEELARHPTVFKSRSGMNFALEHADHCVTGYLNARAIHFRILMRQIVATLALQVLASTVLLGLGGWLVISGELTLGQLVAAELIVTVIVGSFAKVGKYLEGYYDVMAAVDKLGHLFDMPLEHRHGVELPQRDAGIAVALDHAALPDFSTRGPAPQPVAVRFNAGERIALLGTSGALRSQVLDAISGATRAAHGHVEFDGYDLRRLATESIHSQVALIRDREVFAGSIAENIHLGRERVAEEDVRLALAATGLLDELLDLPEGLSTHLDTDGRMLSQDQLIRLMLARAIAGRPRLMLIDGAFDALPDGLLRTVVRGVIEASPSCTLVVSTGRREVAKYFDRHIEVAADRSLQELEVVRPKTSDRPSPRQRRRMHR